MAKQYKVKDINNNGTIDNWEQGKYDAINNSATKMGYSMKMGSKENYSPTNFKTKDATLMAQSPMTMHQPGHDPKKDPNKLKGVTVSTKPKASNDLTLEAFNKQKAQIKSNITAASKKIDSTIKSDSLTSVLNRGSVSKKQQDKFDNLRHYSSFAKKTYGDSKKTLSLLSGHHEAYKGNYGIYKDKDKR
jgi:hypothetical protein